MAALSGLGGRIIRKRARGSSKYGSFIIVSEESCMRKGRRNEKRRKEKTCNLWPQLLQSRHDGFKMTTTLESVWLDKKRSAKTARLVKRDKRMLHVKAVEITTERIKTDTSLLSQNQIILILTIVANRTVCSYTRECVRAETMP